MCHWKAPRGPFSRIGRSVFREATTGTQGIRRATSVLVTKLKKSSRNTTLNSLKDDASHFYKISISLLVPNNAKLTLEPPIILSSFMNINSRKPSLSSLLSFDELYDIHCCLSTASTGRQETVTMVAGRKLRIRFTSDRSVIGYYVRLLR
jgi:hypothetical protein